MESPTDTMEELAWLRRVAVALVGHDGASDLTQEVALEVLRRPPTADGAPLEGPRLRGWLWTVARRKATRRRGEASTRRHSERQAAKLEASASEAGSAQQLRLHAELLAEIEALDSADADLIVRRHLQGKPPRELADELGVPVVTVRKRLSRAMARLRARMVASERGAEGWSLGLCVLVNGGPVGTVLAPSSEGAGTTFAPREGRRVMGSGAAAPPSAWVVATLAMGVVGLGGLAWWFASGAGAGSNQVVPTSVAAGGQEDALDLELAALEAGGQRVSAAGVQGAADRLVEDPAAVAVTPALGRRLRFVDEEGAPVSDVVAVWADETYEPAELVVGDGGTCQLPPDAEGYLFAGAPGFELRDFRLRWSEAETMDAELRRQRRVPGRVTVEGQAPGEPFTLWAGRGGSNRWPSPVFDDKRLQQALTSAGLSWLHGPVPVDADGRFTFVTRATWHDYFVTVPEGYRVLSGGVQTVSFLSDTTELVIDTVKRATFTVQLVYSDGEPLEGVMVWVSPLVAAEESKHQWQIAVGKDGVLEAPVMVQDYEGKELVEESPCFGYELSLRGWSETVRLEAPGRGQDLGRLVIPRAPSAFFEVVMSDANGALRPVRAAVASADDAGSLADRLGRATVRAEVGTEVRVLAKGSELTRVTVQPTALHPATPQQVVLLRSPALSIAYELSDLGGFNPRNSVRVAVEWNALAPLAELDDLGPWSQHGDLFKSLYGRRFYGFYSDRTTTAYFRSVPGRPLRIDGLPLGTSLRVALVDAFEQEMVSRQVAIMSSSAEKGEAIDVAFGDLYDQQAAKLAVDCRWPGSGRAYEGSVQVIASELDRVERFHTGEPGRLEVGPLRPGRYRVFASTSGSTVRAGQGSELNLAPGANAFEVPVSGIEPD